MKKLQGLLFLLFITAAAHAQVNDSVAIIKLLDKEAATWRAGDVTGHTECWHIQPYSVVLVSLPDGRSLNIPPDAMVHPSPGSGGNGGTSVRSNYKMSINGNSAWVAHDEESTAKDGTKSYSYELRLLEKINGDWKLVGQSIHVFKK